MTTMPPAAWDTARRAADRIVGRPAHPSVVKAVLAQWVAENGYRWPPPRHNPGNVARGWASATGVPYVVTYPNPQPGNPIVTFATDGRGADSYALGLVMFPRYNSAVTAARAGNGLLFAVRVCEAGYGTRESTVRSVYAALQAPAIPTPGSTSGGANVAIRYAQVTSTANRARLRQGTALYDRPGGSRVTAMSKDAIVPHVGLAGAVAGQAWRAVVVGTRWSYDDGSAHPTVLYVPAAAAEVIPL